MKLFRYPRPTLRLLGFAVAVALSGSATAADESEAVAATVATFHESLQRGDGAAAMKLLAPDAIILEGGSVETRAEYESHHLAANMAFARAVPSTRSGVQVQVETLLGSRARAEAKGHSRSGR